MSPSWSSPHTAPQHTGLWPARRDSGHPVQPPDRSAKQISGIGFPVGGRGAETRPPPPAHWGPSHLHWMPHSSVGTPPVLLVPFPLPLPPTAWGPSPALMAPLDDLGALTFLCDSLTWAPHLPSSSACTPHPGSCLCQAPFPLGSPGPSPGQIPGLVVLGLNATRVPCTPAPAPLRSSCGVYDMGTDCLDNQPQCPQRLWGDRKVLDGGWRWEGPGLPWRH